MNVSMIVKSMNHPQAESLMVEAKPWAQFTNHGRRETISAIFIKKQDNKEFVSRAVGATLSLFNCFPKYHLSTFTMNDMVLIIFRLGF